MKWSNDGQVWRMGSFKVFYKNGRFHLLSGGAYIGAFATFRAAEAKAKLLKS